MQGSHADEVAASILLGQLETIEVNIPGALTGADPGRLHDLRVAVRRTRTVSQGLAGVFPAEALTRFRADFKWLQQLTNPVRDLDVLLAELQATGDGDLTPVVSVLSKRRTAERQKMRRGLKSARTSKLLIEWRALLQALPESDPEGRPDAKRPIQKLAGARIGERYRKVARLGRRLKSDPPTEAVHELRKRAKDLRYFLEFFSDLYPKRAVKPLRSDLKQLHAVLGSFQDRVIQRQLLRETADELAVGGSDAQPLLAIGAMLGQMSQAQARADTEFAKCFASFAAKQQRAQVKSVFG